MRHRGCAVAQVSIFDGVPLYADTTLEPFSVLNVPVGRSRLREYERRRDRELAGTTGSRAPSFPVQSPSPQNEIWIAVVKDGPLSPYVRR